MSPEAELHTSPQDIVSAGRQAGVEAIAITDHNTVEWLDPVREAAQGQGVLVFPGMEISARGGHVLAIFEVGTPAANLRLLLSRLGFPTEHWGLGFQETGLGMEEVLQLIEDWGGLAIAAHVDRRPRGFLAAAELTTEDRRRIYHSPCLSALEITIPQNKAQWTQAQPPHYTRGRACIQGSDAHAPAEMGRRPFFADVPHLDLSGLRLAFQEFENRIRFPSELGVAYAAAGSGLNLPLAGS